MRGEYRLQANKHFEITGFTETRIELTGKSIRTDATNNIAWQKAVPIIGFITGVKALLPFYAVCIAVLRTVSSSFVSTTRGKHKRCK